ncbi:MAG: C69 family dipeptidase [Deltaproteobacteria bacterium]|nr:C69 family dipeptidase [Deltaproteobacteria bacterium]MBW2396329.1 C69 family dipeptidase [Deltaproteobacteria bacterium]
MTGFRWCAPHSTAMCDTAVRVLPDRVLFAKNSDRDPNEGHLLEWQPSREHRPDAPLRCTWIRIPQARRTHAVLLSRPFWMWGAEIGTNEHGVVIGNEAVFTKQPLAATGLTGMDLLRLGLERASSAEEAVVVITQLLEEHGQGGGCGHEDRSFSYHSSYIVADPRCAFVLETAGQEWTSERVKGARSISNGLTIEPFAGRQKDVLRTKAASAAARRACTEAHAARAQGPADMMALLRDHGGHRLGPRYSRFNGGMGAPCVHAGGRVVNSQTTCSWVSELSPGAVSHWATATAAPCTSLFKPVSVDQPVDLGPGPTDAYDPATLWWRHERLHRRLMWDPENLMSAIVQERDHVEAGWLREPPDSEKAFAEGDRLLKNWTERALAASLTDRRPAWARRYWEKRDQRAGFPVGGTP